MKIATYNINGINGRLEILLRWLKEAQPDIVCLQELKAENHKFPEKAIHQAGYQAVWHGQKSWNGVAILSKTEIQELRNDLPGDDDEFTHSRYIEAFINGIVIGCIYLPNGNPYPGPKFDYKLRWFERLKAHAKGLVDRDLPVILIGDYNVMPTELDTYKPEKYLENALFRPESRKAYKELVEQGWIDAIRTLYPYERIYTFWGYLRDAYGRDAGLRLDHFLLNKAISKKLKAAGVDKNVRGWQGASDHAPVWIELADESIENPENDIVEGNKSVSIAETKLQSHVYEPQGLAEILRDLPVSSLPLTIKPMKATMVDEPFDRPGWIYEIKWDGYRAITTLYHGSATIMSRNNLVFDQFKPINEAMEKWQFNAVIDGEIVALNEQGTADFGALQNWRNSKSAHLAYFIFDILWYDGKDLTGLPLKTRREILDAVLPNDTELIRASQVFDTGGIEFFEAAKKMKLEGIIAKRIDSLYTSDTRSREWLKIKAKRRQEVIIAGFTRNEGTVKYFSALAIGVYDKKGVLRYIGKVGTGFNDAKQKEMMAQFTPIITGESPFDVEPDVDEPSQFRPRRLGAKATWLKPELVCEVEFAEITNDGKVRQASFKGMRSDKNPKDVILEIEGDTEEIVDLVELDAAITIEENHKPVAIKKAAKIKSDKKPGYLLLTSKKETEEVKIDGHFLKLTHLNKFYWPEDKVTKRDMFNYYHQVAPIMVPYLKDRPMSLNRFPGGIHGESFYQKNVRDKAPKWAETMPHINGEGVDKDYLLGNNEATLLWMASLGCIEINPWFSRIQSPDNPDYCIIDLDPDKQHFDQVIQAALEVKKVLDAIDVPSYPKTSGSTGMHIYIPLGAKYTYDQSQLFANIVVKRVQKQIPDFTTLERMISNRKGKMYLDFLQNRPGATIAGVYSLRPKPGATVSMPVTWDEVRPGLTMRDFTIHNAIDRLKETGDLFTGILGPGIDLMTTLGKIKDLDL